MEDKVVCTVRFGSVHRDFWGPGHIPIKHEDLEEPTRSLMLSDISSKGWELHSKEGYDPQRLVEAVRAASDKIADIAKPYVEEMQELRRKQAELHKKVREITATEIMLSDLV